MPLKYISDEITSVNADAIVNTTNVWLYRGHGVDTQVRKAAGPEIEKELGEYGTCAPGEAIVTGGYDTGAKYIIHTVGPVWEGGLAGEGAILRSCYRSCLTKADELECESVVFPLLCSGNNGYPMDLAIKEAVTTILDYLEKSSLTVYLILYNEEARNAMDHFEEEWAAFLEKHPLEPEDDSFDTLGLRELLEDKVKPFGDILRETVALKNMKPAQVYHRAWVEKAAYSKIANNKVKKPKITTIAALAVALRLSPKETDAFLKAAGLAFGSTPFDLIVRYNIGCHNYDVIKINEKLKENNQPLLGSGQKI